MRPPLPLMDKWSRNARLYNTLVGMGLVVRPIPSDIDPEKIECFYVSCELPQRCAENPAVSGISNVMEGTQVSDVVASAEGLGDGKVIHFPAVL